MKKGGWSLVNYESVTCEIYDLCQAWRARLWLHKKSNSAQIQYCYIPQQKYCSTVYHKVCLTKSSNCFHMN